nr:hypothetical protein GCM10010200_082260 [Actinomadura rugatobispora]
MRPGAARNDYLLKRSEERVHDQVVMPLARRRVDVVRAMPRDRGTFTSAPPVTRPA